MRERGEAWPEIGHHALRDAAKADRFAARRPADPFEPFGHPFEALGIGFKMSDELAAWCTRILPQVINPTREAHQRRAELVRRLARHRDPETIAGRVDALAHRPGSKQRQTEEHEAL